MPRPRMCRCVRVLPVADRFHPCSRTSAGQVVLTVDELEALRLADLEHNTQDNAAQSMRVSRQTFGRVIESARMKLADALVSAKTILIQGGTYEMEKREFKCANCDHVWEVPFGIPRPDECPECTGANFHRVGGPHMARHGNGHCCCRDAAAKEA